MRFGMAAALVLSAVACSDDPPEEETLADGLAGWRWTAIERLDADGVHPVEELIFLDIAEDGSVSGRDGCNRFHSAGAPPGEEFVPHRVVTDGDRLEFDGRSGSTLIGCDPHVDMDAFKQLRRRGGTFEVSDDQLLIMWTRVDGMRFEVTGPAGGD